MTQLVQLLWDHNTAFGRAIILLITFLGIIGSLCAIVQRHRYRRFETDWLDYVRGRLSRAQEAKQVVAAGGEAVPFAEEAAPPDTASPPIPAVESAPLFEPRELAQGVPLQSLVGDRLNTLANLKQARARVNVDALQRSSILKESARWSLSFPGYVVSLVMMLGLLGTFIGLSLMVVDIQHALPDAAAQADASRWAASVSSLGRILAGKKTAFSATLAGLLFSIIASGLNFALARAQAGFYDRLERFTSEELLPATIPAFDDATPWEKLSMQLGDSFENLGALTIEQARSTERMIAVEKTFATIVDNIETISQRAATAPLQGMTGEMTNVIGMLTQVNGAIVGLTEKLPQLASSIGSAMQGQQASIDRLARAMQSNRPAERRFDRVSFAAGGAVIVVVLALIVRWLS